MISRRLILLCLPICLLLGLALPALGVAKKVRFGVQGERAGSQTLSKNEVMRMRQGKVDIVRTPFEWELVQKTGPSQPYDFSNFDKLVQWATEGGLPKLKILPILIGSPEWVKRSEGNNEPPVTNFDLDKWKQFVQTAVSRYKNSGVLDQWQVWNEPNLGTFWTNHRPNAKAYAKFLDITNKAIKRGNSQADSVLAGMPQRRDAPKPAKAFLEQLYKVKGFKDDFDIGAVHPFTSSPKEAVEAVEEIRGVMDKGKDKRKDLWVTEVGYASTGPNSPFTSTPSGQAKLLRKTFDALKKSSKKLRLAKVVWYSWRDSDTDPPKFPSNNRWQTYAGLFNFNGAPKPSWTAFTKETGGNVGSGSLLPDIAAKPMSKKPLAE